MPLTELVLDGFKSFADKTTIHFDDGITGIVGPNGSGKSNITEAVRWVMGESSAKSLRGTNMKDVIFAGSQFRKPLNKAEVTLVLIIKSVSWLLIQIRSQLLEEFCDQVTVNF